MIDFEKLISKAVTKKPLRNVLVLGLLLYFGFNILLELEPIKSTYISFISKDVLSLIFPILILEVLMEINLTKRFFEEDNYKEGDHHPIIPPLPFDESQFITTFEGVNWLIRTSHLSENFVSVYGPVCPNPNCKMTLETEIGLLKNYWHCPKCNKKVKRPSKKNGFIFPRHYKR